MTRLRDRRLTTVDMVGKRKTIREKILKYPVRKWDWRNKDKYYKWVKETYGDVVNPDAYVVGYRAWRELVWSMETPTLIDREPTQILTTTKMIEQAQQILSESIRKVYVDHANNNNRL
jgi:asparagine synthetase B (glutamine-hydrolysing)